MRGFYALSSSPPLTEAQEKAVDAQHAANLRAYLRRTTPTERATDERQAALNQMAWNQQQIASNQQIMIQNQQKALEQQREFQQQREQQESWDRSRQLYEQQQPRYYQGTVDESGNVQVTAKSGRTSIRIRTGNGSVRKSMPTATRKGWTGHSVMGCSQPFECMEPSSRSLHRLTLAAQGAPCSINTGW